MASQHLNASGVQGDGGKLAHYAHRAVCRRSASWARVVSVTAGMSQLGCASWDVRFQDETWPTGAFLLSSLMTSNILTPLSPRPRPQNQHGPAWDALWTCAKVPSRAKEKVARWWRKATRSYQSGRRAHQAGTG